MTGAELSGKMKDPRAQKRNLVMFSGITVLVLSLFTAMVFGTANTTFTDLYNVFVNPQNTESYRILYHIRIPRVLTCMFAGVNLAIAGCILQGVLKNPLADPGIIGVSSGAGLAAMIVMIVFPQHTAIVPIVAFVGAMVATMILFMLAWENGIQPLKLILAGVAVSAFFGGGMTCLMVFFSDKIQGTVNWMAGGFSGASWKHVTMILPYTVIGLLGATIGCRYLNALQLGDDVAKSLGTRVETARFLLVTLAALLAASAVSVAGMLTFVGLIVPHMMRLVVGSDFNYLLPSSAIFGGILLIVADTVARTAFQPIEVPVGVFMSFIGAPFFLYLLKRGMQKR